MKRNKSLTYLASTLAVLFWGMSYIWADSLLNNGIPVFYFIFVRILIAGIILLLLNLVTVGLEPIRRRDIPKFFLVSFCEPFIYFITETYGIKATGSPTISALIIATIPIFSMGAGIIFFKEKISRINRIGVLLSLVGIVLVAMSKGEIGDNFIWGIILLFIAVFSEVAHASLTKSLLETYTSQNIVMYQFMIGALYLLPLFIWKGLEDFDPSLYLSAEVWTPILCLAVLCSSAAFTLWVSTIKTLGVARSSIFSALIPVVSALIAWVIGREVLTTRQWIGIAIAVLGVILSQYVSKETR